MEGYLLTGRHGLYSTPNQGFALVEDASMLQPARKMAGILQSHTHRAARSPDRGLETALNLPPRCWRCRIDNVHSPDRALSTAGKQEREVVRVYCRPMPTALLAVAEEAFWKRTCVETSLFLTAEATSIPHDRAGRQACGPKASRPLELAATMTRLKRPEMEPGCCGDGPAAGDIPTIRR